MTGLARCAGPVVFLAGVSVGLGGELRSAPISGEAGAIAPGRGLHRAAGTCYNPGLVPQHFPWRNSRRFFLPGETKYDRDR